VKVVAVVLEFCLMGVRHYCVRGMIERFSRGISRHGARSHFSDVFIICFLVGTTVYGVVSLLGSG